jgi:riboflavin kinase/FMN adenylyltransferase
MRVLDQNDRLNRGTVAATIGMFDGVHLGHATLISTLKQQATVRNLQSAVITFRQHPQIVLNPDSDLRTILNLDDRIEEIGNLSPDFTVLLDFTRQLAQLNSSDFIKLLRDNYGVALLVMGYNHHFGHDTSESFADYVRQGDELGVEVIKAPEYLGEFSPVSSSIIRRLITAGKVNDANDCMGRPFTISGTVVHGFHNGSTIGFPTANIGNVDPALILPHNGAYAVNVIIDHQRRQGMVNLGYRPTVTNGSKLTIEVNIFDFNDDIYGKPITLEFIRFLRLEFKLESIDELKAQLTSDRQKAIEILDEYNKNHKHLNNGNHQFM